MAALALCKTLFLPSTDLKSFRVHRPEKSGCTGQMLTSCAKLSACMPSITTLDNLWTGRPHTIASALLESDGHRSIVDPVALYRRLNFDSKRVFDAFVWEG